MALPRMVRIKQHFDTPVVADLPAAVKEELDQIGTPSIIGKGDSVAIGGGSRGVANIAVVIKATADYLKDIGAKPFVVPAMGSHGGATAEGQRAVLEHYGVTEETVGVPIKATMEVVEIGRTADELPVFLDTHAANADHIVPINRIKAHTDFRGTVESGTLKMLTIGFGKQHGANMYHRAFFHYGFEHIIRTVTGLLIDAGKVGFRRWTSRKRARTDSEGLPRCAPMRLCAVNVNSSSNPSR